jgi:uncharacterized protein with von Willebrand factor type A (vWA) domain
MFIDFFYQLKNAGIPVSPTSFLTLQKALDMGLLNSVDAFYTSARAILVKSERYFDRYDQIFAHRFQDAEMPVYEGLVLDEITRALLEGWLEDPVSLAAALEMDASDIMDLTPEELIEYFKKRLEDQKGRHEGGRTWIGTGGTSPTGHSGYHPGGMRVGGVSRNKSAVKVAMERRYKDYSRRGLLTQDMIGEALKRLRNMVPVGPKDEIDIVFSRRLKDRIKVILAVDNGGWSMDPYIPVVQTLFDYARDQFKDLKTYFFHNTVYDYLWEDPARINRPIRVEDFISFDPQTRFIMVGDGSMAPYELMAADGSIHVEERSGKPSIEQLKFLAKTFPHCVWLNPVSSQYWQMTTTITTIRQIFPMFELTLDGLEDAVSHLMAK